MRSILLAVGCAITSLSMSAQSVTYRPLEISSQLQQPLEVTSETQHPLGIASNRAHLGVASDWTQHHVLFPVSKNSAVMARLQSNPRYTQSWYLRHREIWWPGVGRGRLKALNLVHRDWSEPLGFTGPSYFITAITQSGTTVTVTTNIDHVFISGQAVMISGISAGTGGCSSAAAAAIDGVQTLTSAQGFNATFTFTSSQSATITGGECTLSTTAAAMGPTPFEPIHDFTFNVADAGTETGFGALNAVNLSDLNVLNSSATAFDVGYMATAGTLTLTNNGETGAPLETYPQLMSADNPYIFIDSLLFPNYPNTTLPFDDPGIAFTDSSLPPNEYQMLISTYMVGGVPTLELWTGWYVDGTFQKSGRGILPSTVFNNDPDGGQTWPAKYTFNVNEAPSCSGDYVAIGVPANAVAGAQANIVGYNNLYSRTGGGYCSGTGPKVMFAYASGTGEVPGSISLSTNGTQLAYIEDQLSGSSVFHVLTIGTGKRGHQSDRPRDARCRGKYRIGYNPVTLRRIRELRRAKLHHVALHRLLRQRCVRNHLRLDWCRNRHRLSLQNHQRFRRHNPNHRVERSHQCCSIEPGMGYNIGQQSSLPTAAAISITCRTRERRRRIHPSRLRPARRLRIP